MTSQKDRVLIQLRDLILKGQFAPGARLAEVPLAERLGASRTPIRLALGALEREGLIDALPSGGYVMKQFGRREVDDAIVVRGHLEGLAARLIAEHGVPRMLATALKDCLAEGDRVLAAQTLDYDDYAAYVSMNDRLHGLIVEGAGNMALTRAVELTCRLPLAAPSAMLPMQASMDEGRTWLLFAHRQHHHLVEAMTRGEGTRAQALAEEHSSVARLNLEYALAQPETAARVVPALKLMVDG